MICNIFQRKHSIFQVPSLNAGDTLEAISRTDYSVFSSSSDDSDAQDEEIHDPQL